MGTVRRRAVCLGQDLPDDQAPQTGRHGIDRRQPIDVGLNALIAGKLRAYPECR